MVVIIKKLIWELANTRHIARHHVNRDEVEELMRNVYFAKPALHKRVILLGETDMGRVLELVIVPKGRGRYYPLTCYDANKDMVALYKRMKGGERK